jgi:hypothetical protein
MSERLKPVTLDATSADEEGVEPWVPTDSPALRRALLKLDVFLLPVCTFIYFLNFLDRYVSQIPD